MADAIQTGLGLFISRKLCQLHGGDIGVASKYGSGSTFGFFFRVKRSDPPEGVESGDDSDAESLADTASKDVAARNRASSLQSDSKNEEFDQPTLRNVEPRQRMRDRDMPESLMNPPTEFREEAHPGISTDERHNITSKVAERVSSSERERCLEDSAPKVKKDDKAKRNIPIRTKGDSPSKPEKSTATNSSSIAPSKPSGGKQNILLAEDNIVRPFKFCIYPPFIGQITNHFPSFNTTD